MKITNNMCFIVSSLLIAQWATAADDAALIEGKYGEFIRTNFSTWLPEQSVSVITPLTRNHDNDLVCAIKSSSDQEYVIAFMETGFRRDVQWRQAEIKAMRDAAQAGVSPEVIASRAQSTQEEPGYVLMRKINTIPLEQIPWSKESTYTQLGEFLKKMHSQPSTIDFCYDSMYERSNRWIEQIEEQWKQKNDRGLPREFEKLKMLLNTAQPVLRATTKRDKLVHGNLLLGNVLHDGQKFWAIDWKQSQLAADPMVDLAIIYNCLVPDAGTGKMFMQGYCGKNELPKEENEHFKIMNPVASCFMGLAYALQLPDTFSEQFKDHVENNIDTGKALHAIMRAGFPCKTKQDCVTFGTLLFLRGYQSIDEAQKLLNQRSQDDKAKQ